MNIFLSIAVLCALFSNVVMTLQIYYLAKVFRRFIDEPEAKNLLQPTVKEQTIQETADKINESFEVVRRPSAEYLEEKNKPTQVKEEEGEVNRDLDRILEMEKRGLL